MVSDSDDVRRLRELVDRQVLEIATLRRPRHWRSEGVRGAQAMAWHESLDRALERLVRARAWALRIRRRPDPHVGNPDLALAARFDELEPFITRVLNESDSIQGFERLAFLLLVALTARCPERDLVERLADRLALEPDLAAVDLREQTIRVADAGSGSKQVLRVVTEQLLVDVTWTTTHVLDTGVQRVVRQVAARWAERHDVILVWWDDELGGLRALSDAGVERLRASIGAEGPAQQLARVELRADPPELLLPIGTTVVIPEVVPERDRLEYYSMLAQHEFARIALVGYDMIPITAAETRVDSSEGWFADYLTLVKRSARLAAISESAADEFRAFRSMLRTQGLVGPDIGAYPLPAGRIDVDDGDLLATAHAFAVGDDPVILVVGTTEPRKNQRTVLHAAERLWSTGHRFHLILVGGWGWANSSTYALARSLVDRRRRLTFAGPVSERQLWSLYRLATCTVFPSLVEGFGLPIAESLACGTPVITSAYGAMADVASRGGCLTIDPRDVDAVAHAMHQMLMEDHLIERLRTEARSLPDRQWTDFADDVWRFLTL